MVCYANLLSQFLEMHATLNKHNIAISGKHVTHTYNHHI